MRGDDDLTSLGLGVLLALLFAVAFALSFLWSYSPERLLVQGLLAAMVVDGFRPFLAKVSGGAVRTLSAIAYFTPRIFMVAMLSSWFFTGVPKLFSEAMAHTGWAFAAGVGHVVLVVFVVAMAALSILFRVLWSVWNDAFGPKAQDG